EGKLEDSLTLKEFLEEGYKSDPISQSCYSYLDIRNLSLD
ncbi:6269_t:CDS:1, partial [Entrophospora sp. SA101]